MCLITRDFCIFNCLNLTNQTAIPSTKFDTLYNFVNLSAESHAKFAPFKKLESEKVNWAWLLWDALTSGVCNICGKNISIGEACSPSEKSGWVHFACFQGSMEKLAICGFYRRFSKCVHEQNCAYSHLLINVPFRRKRKKKRLKTWNKERATILRIFLLKNYGEEFLKQGDSGLTSQV